MPTSLSAGLIVYDILSKDATVKQKATKVFPVLTDQDVELPYVCYHREHHQGVSVKSGAGADTAIIQVSCYGATYTQSVELGEAVRAAMEGKEHTYSTIHMRACVMTDAQEYGTEEGNFVQELTFECRIN
jgi:hypothetical protein